MFKWFNNNDFINDNQNDEIKWIKKSKRVVEKEFEDLKIKYDSQQEELIKLLKDKSESFDKYLEYFNLSKDLTGQIKELKKELSDFKFEIKKLEEENEKISEQNLDYEEQITKLKNQIEKGKQKNDKILG